MALRVLGVNVSVFTLGAGVYIGDLYDASLTLNTVTDESKSVANRWSIPTAYKRNWSIDATLACNTTVTMPITGILANGNSVAVTFTTGDGSYTGNATFTKCDHKVSKGVQTWSLTLSGQGALTRT